MSPRRPDPESSPTYPEAIPLPNTLPPSGSFDPDTHPQAQDATKHPDLSFLAPRQAPDELGRLGSFRALKVLGSGGMGVVFLAEDVHLKRRVALKVMKPTIATNAEARLRFIREAQATAAVENEHIITIFQVGEERGVPFLAMQLLQGESLAERLKRDRKLPMADVWRIGRETATGLAAAHARGLIHRDIKPANLWLEAGKGRVKILDFGLARVADAGTVLTHSGTFLGTPAYMAPEQANGETTDGRADLFSLGCVLYQLLIGELPFKGANVMSILSALANHHPAPPQTVNPLVPAPLSDLVMKLLCKNPAGRPASAQAVVDELNAMNRRKPAPPPADAVRPPSGRVAFEPPLPSDRPPSGRIPFSPAAPVPVVASSDIRKREAESEDLAGSAEARPEHTRSGGPPRWLWYVGGAMAVLFLGVILAVWLAVSRLRDFGEGANAGGNRGAAETRIAATKSSTHSVPIAGTSATRQESGWYEYRSKPGGFSVEMPGLPVVTSETFEIKSGGEGVTHKAKLQDDRTNLIFTVSYSDYPGKKLEQSEERLSYFRDLLLDKGKKQLVGEMKMRVLDLDGREVVYEDPVFRKQERVRYCIAPQRMFMIFVTGSANDIKGPAADRFFKSLRSQARE